MEEREKVTNGDIEFAMFLAESEDLKEQKKEFLLPGNIFKIYVETSYDDESEEDEPEVIYNVYTCVDGMYFPIGLFKSKKEAVKFARNSCIQLEKTLKQRMIDCVSNLPKKENDYE